MIKAIFFDWADTFTRSDFGDNHKEEINNLLKSHGLTWDIFYPYWKNFYWLRSKSDIKNDKEMFVQLGKVLQKESVPFEKIRDILIDSHIIPDEHIEIMKELKKDYKVGIISNNVQEWVKRVLVNYKIESLFDTIIVSSKVGARKPDARIFYAALNALSVEPEETVFISDEVADDLVGAKGCGMRTIWLDTGIENEWKRKEREIARIFLPDAIIKNLKEVIPIIKNM